jgi:hypothetical protein
MKYKYITNEDGTKTLKIYLPNGDLIVMNLSIEVEGHTELISFLQDEEKLKNYVMYLASNPDRAFNLEEILSL